MDATDGNPTTECPLPASRAEIEPIPLELQQLDVRFGPVHALRGVNLRVHAGEVRGLLGHNGAGKSTLMRAVAGLVHPTSGTVRVLGRRPKTPGAARRYGVRVVHQELSLVDTLSVADNIFLGEERLRGSVLISRRKELEETSALFESLNINIDPSESVSVLSRADRELVEIARAVRAKSSVLLLDEPTAPLAPREVTKLLEVIRTTAETGTAILLVTHHIDEVFKVCNTATVLRDGQVVLDRKITDTRHIDIAAAISGRDLHVSEDAPSRAGDTAGPAAASRGADRRDERREALFEATGITVPGKFEDVSFRLYPGEVVGLVGLVGSGRSTMLKTLAGAIQPRSGTLTIDGTVYGPASFGRATRGKIYRLPEDRRTEGLLLEHEIALNVVLARLAKVRRGGFYDRPAARDASVALCERLGVRMNSVRDPVRVLSGGNQQKILFARALFAESSVLLLDEPTFGVDVGAAADIADFVRDHAHRGGTAIWCSSDLRELSTVVDRVLILRRGELTPASLTRNEISETRLLELLGELGVDTDDREGQA